MSFINFGLVNPRLVITTDAVAGSTPLGGLLFRPADQALYVSNGGAIARWLNGLPITADGRVVVSLANGAVGRYKDGLAFNSLDQLLLTSTFPVASRVNGWPVDAEGRICSQVAGPVPGAFNFTDADFFAGFVSLAWAVSAGADEYLVYRDSVLIATVAAPDDYYDDYDIANATYTYAIVAVNTNGTTPSTPPTRQVVVEDLIRQVFAVAILLLLAPAFLGDSRVVVWSGGGKTYVDTITSPSVTPYLRAAMIVDAIIAGQILPAQFALAIAAITALVLDDPVYVVTDTGVTVGPPPGYTETYNWPGWPSPP